VALDSLLAQVEAACNLRVVQSFGDQLQHLELPVGEVVEDVWLGAPGSVEFPDHTCSHPRVQHGLASGGLSYRFGGVVRARLLEGGGEGAGPDSREDVF